KEPSRGAAMDTQKILSILPEKVRNRVDPFFEAIEVMGSVRDPKVAASLVAAGVRGLLLDRGKQSPVTQISASHEAYFDWTYASDQPEMLDLYRRAKSSQWDGEKQLDWSISVDPLTPEVAVIPHTFINCPKLEEFGVRLAPRERA